MNPLSLATAAPPQTDLKNGLRSTAFDDVYFNTESNLADASYVFLEGNDLTERWQKQAADELFVVAETGFGSGLNLLLLLRLWQKQELKPEKLHVISCELHPFAKAKLKEVLAQFPELQSQSEILLAKYPSERFGFHRFNLSDSVSVTLMFGDATACYEQCHAQVDAWFLDGFDPKKNPDMWSEQLLQHVRRLSRKGTTIATYTAAANIRRLIQAQGFHVIKRPGFGKKREMITAVMQVQVETQTVKQDWAPIKVASQHQDIVVLGAGIAGLSVSRACAMAGHAVTLIDRKQPMQEASGNPLAMIMPYFTAQSSLEALFYWRAYDYALSAYSNDSNAYDALGILEWCLNDKRKAWADTLFAGHTLPSELIQRKPEGVFYPSAGVVDTQILKQDWLKFTQQVIQAEVVNFLYEGEKWLLLDANGTVVKSCDVLVVTAGINSLQLSPFEHLPLVAKHGQISVIQSDEQLPFTQVQRHKGYAIPISDKRCVLGATFDHLEKDSWFNEPDLHPEHLLRNLAKWNDFDQWKLPPHNVLYGKAGIRTTTPDHLPVCGAAVEEAPFRNDYADLHHGRHWKQYPEAKTLPHLYLMSGLGARGFTSAPLLGQLLADMILGRPLPVEIDLCKMLHPNRFLYKQLKQNK